MRVYTRTEIVRILSIDERLLDELVAEHIVDPDAPGAAEAFSEVMLERARVAQNLVRELDVNLPGVEVILRLREELSALRRRLAELTRR